MDLDRDTRLWLEAEMVRHDRQVRESVSRPEAHTHALIAREEFWRDFGPYLRAGRYLQTGKAS